MLLRRRPLAIVRRSPASAASSASSTRSRARDSQRRSRWSAPRAAPRPRAGPSGPPAGRPRSRAPTRCASSVGEALPPWRRGQRRPEVAADAGGEVADGGRLHLAPCSQVLEQHGPELDDLERGLAAGDDGVHTGTIRIVRADPAVAVAVEPGGVAAGPTVALTRDQVGERLVTDLRTRAPRETASQFPLSPSLRGRGVGTAAAPPSNDAGGRSSGGFGRV